MPNYKKWSNDLQLPNEGDFIAFKEVEGMIELNDGKPRKIKSIKSKNTFISDDFRKYIKNGFFTEKKISKKISFFIFDKN